MNIILKKQIPRTIRTTWTIGYGTRCSERENYSDSMYERVFVLSVIMSVSVWYKLGKIWHREVEHSNFYGYVYSIRTRTITQVFCGFISTMCECTCNVRVRINFISTWFLLVNLRVAPPDAITNDCFPIVDCSCMNKK